MARRHSSSPECSGLPWIPCGTGRRAAAPARSDAPKQHGGAGHAARPPPVGLRRRQRPQHDGLLPLVQLDHALPGGRAPAHARAGGLVRVDSAGLRRGAAGSPADGSRCADRRAACRRRPRASASAWRRAWSAWSPLAIPWAPSPAWASAGISLSILRRRGLQRQHVHAAARYLRRRAGGLCDLRAGVELRR